MPDTPRILFSFSLYGSNDKYTKGMLANCRMIRERFPTAHIYVYVATDVPPYYSEQLHTFPHVTVKNVERKEGLLNSYDRLLAIDDDGFDFVFFRDADSRVNERDACCIEDFMNDSKALHIIRDHKYQIGRILAGLFGLRKSLFPYNMAKLMSEWLASNRRNDYGCEEQFLNETIYGFLRHSMRVNDRHHKFAEESVSPFRSPIVNGDFLGQTHNVDAAGKETLQYHVL